ncbi:MAG TPA: GNAT family N-acetyltransferase [Gammaproteobacteria bacterium]|nr:GNAT family N-acetyltransferase [Gammaproteobacteria bacterium]
MLDYQIIPITEEHIEGFCAAVDSVSRERKYLTFLEGPPLEMSQVFVRENLRDHWPHFVAISHNKVVGWCDITTLNRPVFEHAGTLGIGVIASHRGQGIGKRLIEAALAAAKLKGLTRIELSVRENNKTAIAFYEKVGFVKEGLHRHAVKIGDVYENHISMALLF